MARQHKLEASEEPKRYAVAWIDMLGQADILARIKDAGESPEEAAETDRMLLRSVRAVREFRKRIRGYYHAQTSLPPLAGWLWEPARSRIAELRYPRVKLRGVFDAMCLWVPLTDDKAAGLWDINAFLYLCASVMLIGIFLGEPIRGGIEIGRAVEVEKGELYGPAQSRAYTLESKGAEYPRILVGDELMKHLRLFSVRDGPDVEARLAHRIATTCLELTADDDDGKRILHYLSSNEHDQFLRAYEAEFGPGRGAPFVKQEIARGYRFIVSELERFRKEGNTKLAGRYLRLMSYFNLYVRNWS